jgi:hypothetical protein
MSFNSQETQFKKQSNITRKYSLFLDMLNYTYIIVCYKYFVVIQHLYNNNTLYKNIVCYKYFVVIQHLYNNNTLYKNIKFRTKDKNRPLNVTCPL